MGRVSIGKDGHSRITVAFSYNPEYIEKIKAIPGHRWHPEGKHWSFPDTNDTLEKILKVFEGEEIHIDPVLQRTVPDVILSKAKDLGDSSASPQNDNVESGLSLAFEDLRRELISRKYSYKTVKGYIYFNRDFLNFTGKQPADINDNDNKRLPSLSRRRKAICNIYDESGN